MDFLCFYYIFQQYLIINPLVNNNYQMNDLENNDMGY